MTKRKLGKPALRFETRDGERFEGDTPFQVVDAMRAASTMTEHKTLDKYLLTAAQRFAQIENVIVRADSPETFLADLVAAGILKEVTS